MQFYEPSFLIAFWFAPLLVLIFLWAARRKQRRWSQLGETRTVLRMAANFSGENWYWRALLTVAVFTLLTLSLTRPQWGAEKKKIERRGLDVIFLLDTSLSMLAADIKPSRIEKSKLEIKSVLKKMKGDRVGLIAFAGSSFLQSPLTLDYAAFLLFLDAIQVGYIPDPGSSLEGALQRLLQSFPEGERKFRTAVLFSDGEIHGEPIDTVLKKVKEGGIRMYAIGTGTKDGEPIPLRAEKGKVTAYKKDRSGQIVISRLDESLLVKIASATGGLYYPATAGEKEVDLILQHMQSLGKRQLKEQIVTEKEEQYQAILFFAFLLLLWETIIGERRKNSQEVFLTQ